MRAKMRRAALALAAVAVCAAAGCGTITTPYPSGTSGTSGTAPASSAAGLPTGSQYALYYKPNGTATITAGQTLTITLGTLSFKPNTLTVAKGTPVTIKLVNSAALAHNFSLDAWSVKQNVASNSTQTVSFTPDQTGTYYFYCNVSGHAQAGMVGRLTVQ